MLLTLFASGMFPRERECRNVPVCKSYPALKGGVFDFFLYNPYGYVMKKASFRDYTVVVEQDEDGFYVGEVVELPGCHSQARSVEELMERMKEAVALCLEVSSEGKAPTFIALQKIRVPAPSSG